MKTMTLSFKRLWPALMIVASFMPACSDDSNGTQQRDGSITDGTNQDGSATNHDPVAADDSAQTTLNQSVSIDVLANDTDPDGDALTVSNVAAPAHGTASIEADGTVTYRPKVGFAGEDTFTYTAQDDQGGSGHAQVTVTVTSTSGKDYYVATDGDDTNPGTADEPFATLNGAQAAIRAIKTASGLPDGGITVWIREGIYDRTETFHLTSEDSGDASAPITYRSVPDETVRIIGALRLDPADFVEVTNDSIPDVWSRIDEAAHGHVMQVDLSAYTTDYGTLTDRGFGGWSGDVAALELFFDGEPMQLARWPDADDASPFARVDSAISDTRFTYLGNRPDRWTQAEEIWFHGYWRHMWADRYMNAVSIDHASKTVTLAAKPGYGIADGQPYYALNLLEEITKPGEWYLNRDTGILYFWPPATMCDPDPEVFVSILAEPLLFFDDVEYVRFSGITFEMGRDHLIRIDGGAHDRIDHCVIRNAGRKGVLIRGGANNGVERCDITNTGDDGVDMNSGDRASITLAKNYVRNCHIHQFSRWVWTYTPAVRLAGAGNIIAHNLMENAPHTAILFGGNEQVIEYNHIHDVCIWSSDAGAIYTGRHWGYRNNVVRYNFIHDVDSSFEGYGTHGIYLDDCVSGITVFGNVLYRISGNAIQEGGGRDNTMVNNVIARCGRGLAADTRGTSRIVHDGSSWDLLLKLEQMNYKQEPWKSAYPRVYAIPDDWNQIQGSHWLYPEGCIFSRNIGFANDTWIHGTSAVDHYEEVVDNIEDEDPHFVDEANLDLSLQADSPAYDITGFQPIPFDDIGIQQEP
ncbi:MAG: cadherin-like domain-containing protein [Deltaproteobacteria bacterium]|nr:cadherin-like domain-containing protein [Deltaproteobacteria bacterium]